MGPNSLSSMPPVLWLRALACVFVGGWLVGMPLARQVFEVESDYLHRWVMFTGFGLDICEVRFSTRGAAGEKERVDRFAVLADSGLSSKQVQFVRSRAEARGLGRRLCSKMGSHADLRLFARCATREGWWVVSKPDRNLCASGQGEP